MDVALWRADGDGGEGGSEDWLTYGQGYVVTGVAIEVPERCVELCDGTAPKMCEAGAKRSTHEPWSP